MLAGRVQKKSTINTDGAASMEEGAAAKAANSGGSGSGFKATAEKTSFSAWYESWLEKAPVVTKMVTGAILWGLGDVVAQVSSPLATMTTGGLNLKCLQMLELVTACGQSVSRRRDVTRN